MNKELIERWQHNGKIMLDLLIDLQHSLKYRLQQKEERSENIFDTHTTYNKYK